jgi:hypothetical protein
LTQATGDKKHAAKTAGIELTGSLPAFDFSSFPARIEVVL